MKQDRVRGARDHSEFDLLGDRNAPLQQRGHERAHGSRHGKDNSLTPRDARRKASGRQYQRVTLAGKLENLGSNPLSRPGSTRGEECLTLLSDSLCIRLVRHKAENRKSSSKQVMSGMTNRADHIARDKRQRNSRRGMSQD